MGLLCANTGNLKISRQLFFDIGGVTSTDSWPLTRHFFCHGSVNAINQEGDGFLVWPRRIRHVCHHFSVTLWKHDNRSIGHAFLYVRCARILMYKQKSWCIYLFANRVVYIRILVCMYESCCTYINLDVYITVLPCKFMILLFCPFLSSILSQMLSK